MTTRTTTAIDPEDLVRDLAVLVPIADAAEHCHVTVRTIRNWITDGRLRTLRTTVGKGSGCVLIPRAELARLLAGMIDVKAIVD